MSHISNEKTAFAPAKTKRACEVIYDQIYNQIKDQIIQGALQPDEAMPSIRGLARDLRISVITTKRAYDELEKEGFLYAVPAKGFFVAPKNTELLREENLKKFQEGTSYVRGFL